eukprot:jgi/Mesen1/5658/ME000286S04866
MGACMSDQSAGQQAAGGLEATKAGAANANGINDIAEAAKAVALMTNSKGLSTQLESDPLLVLYQRNASGSWEEVGRTEVVTQSQNPKWVTQLFCLYKFEDTQELWFRIFDVDTSKYTGTARDVEVGQLQVLGEAECLMVEIVTAKNQTLNLELQPSKDGRSASRAMLGSLRVQAEEIAMANALVTMQMRAVNLDKKDFFGKSDAFLRISRGREDSTWAPVYKTEVVLNSLNPSWQPVRITLQQLCNGDLDRPLQFECLDFDLSGNHDHIGTMVESLRGLQQMVQSSESKPLTRPSKHKDPSKPGGAIVVTSCQITPRHSFLDFVFGGCEISFMVAVDFTASNGDPKIPGTLHHMDDAGSPNAYQQAIQAMGEVIQFYDTDKRFPAWGFGGKPQDQPVSHCFALNGNAASPDVEGVEGILGAYVQAINNVTLAGPTLFAPVINTASGFASQSVTQDSLKYWCLLIITDGVITDLDNTVASLVHASSLPLSIFIFGVGNADFTRMEVLDSDRHRLVTAEGQMAVRDNVEFFPMRDYSSTAQLAQKMLSELPGQLLTFMESKDYVPGPRRYDLPSPHIPPSSQEQFQHHQHLQQQQQPLPPRHNPLYDEYPDGPPPPGYH